RFDLVNRITSQSLYFYLTIKKLNCEARAVRSPTYTVQFTLPTGVGLAGFIYKYTTIVLILLFLIE
ncbi:hypothetical protein, partial [Virgibacillus sp. LDC-1]|uniref:hypothetical protein n=1 Tax=Virgibacillus sp. LDC-1 TaxID=3039856 RepID=UPI0024DE5BA0